METDPLDVTVVVDVRIRTLEEHREPRVARRQRRRPEHAARSRARRPNQRHSQCLVAHHRRDVLRRLDAVARLQRTCSGPAYSRGPPPSTCPRSHGSPGRINFPHRQHTASPRATRAAYIAFTRRCGRPYLGTANPRLQLDDFAGEPPASTPVCQLGQRFLATLRRDRGEKADRGAGCPLASSKKSGSVGRSVKTCQSAKPSAIAVVVWASSSSVSCSGRLVTSHRLRSGAGCRPRRSRRCRRSLAGR